MDRMVKVGVGVLVYKDGKLLMAKRQNAHGDGTWAPLGGHLEYGEDYAECARRECMEEGGITIKSLRFKTITNDIFEADDKHYITIWIEADYDDGDVCVNAVDEHTDIGWFDMNHLPQPLFTSIKNLLAGKWVNTGDKL